MRTIIVLHLSEFHNQLYLMGAWDREVVRDSICLQLHDDQSKMGTVRFDFFKGWNVKERFKKVCISCA